MNDKWREDEDLDPETLELLRSLPRETQPTPELQERLVTQLRRDGVIGAAAGASGVDAAPPATSRPVAAGRNRRVWVRRLGQVAAALVIFTFGMGLGRATLDRQEDTALVAEPLGLAANIQGAGTAYVNALAALTEISGSLEPGEREQAREVAMAAFYSAAAELFRIAPDELMTAFAIASADRPSPGSPSEEPRPEGAS